MTEKKLRVYRQYITYEILTAQTMKVSARYYLFIPQTIRLWVYPMNKYLSSMEAKNSDDEVLPILSYDELDELIMIQGQVKSNKTLPKMPVDSEQTLRNMMIGQIDSGVNEESEPLQIQKNMKKSLHHVGILLPEQEGDYFEEITITWTEQISKIESKSFNPSLFVEREEIIQPTTTNSTYVNLIVDEKKYEFTKAPSVTAKDDKEKNCPNIKEGEEYRKLLESKHQYVYRIKRDCAYTFNFSFKIGLPKTIKAWAWLAFSASIGAILFSWCNFLTNNTSYQDDLKLLAGIVSLIVALRALVFHDYELMSIWNKVFLILIAVAIGTVILIMLIHGHPLPQIPNPFVH